jgi:hypothetical protein
MKKIITPNQPLTMCPGYAPKGLPNDIISQTSSLQDLEAKFALGDASLVKIMSSDIFLRSPWEKIVQNTTSVAW